MRCPLSGAASERVCSSSVIEDGDDGLQDDGAGVEIFVDEVDGASGELDAVVEGCFADSSAGEGRQERTGEY